MRANNIQTIHSEQDYQAVLDRIEQLMDAQAGTSELDELDVLATLVERYEEQNFPINEPDPLEAIRFRREQARLLL